jgi:hypothetical protein
MLFRGGGVGMPKRNEHGSEETEKGFGTGLRVKLEGRRETEPAHPDSLIDDIEAEAEPLVESVEDVEESEPSETEQLWTELEESLAREEQLKRTLEEQAGAYARTRELAGRLERRELALQKREQQLEEQIRALEAQAAQAKEAGAQAEPGEVEHGRIYLRQRLEENAEPVWRVFQEALTATKTNGHPDLRTRLMAAATLLGEAYGDNSLLSPGEQVAAARDELAGMRAKRASKPKSR